MWLFRIFSEEGKNMTRRTMSLPPTLLRVCIAITYMYDHFFTCACYTLWLVELWATFEKTDIHADYRKGCYWIHMINFMKLLFIVSLRLFSWMRIQLFDLTNNNINLKLTSFVAKQLPVWATANQEVCFTGLSWYSLALGKREVTSLQVLINILTAWIY